jgi:hypothetical protein
VIRIIGVSVKGGDDESGEKRKNDQTTAKVRRIIDDSRNGLIPVRRIGGKPRFSWAKVIRFQRHFLPYSRLR